MLSLGRRRVSRNFPRLHIGHPRLLGGSASFSLSGAYDSLFGTNVETGEIAPPAPPSEHLQSALFSAKESIAQASSVQPPFMEESGPFIWFAQQMHTLHELYSIPHWQIIAGSILAVRLLNLPLFFNAAGSGARMRRIQLLLDDIMKRFTAANKSGDRAKALQFYKERKELLKKHKVSMMAPLAGMLLQIPLGIGMFYGTRRLLNDAEYIPEIMVDGPLWLYDITAPDPLYVLPLASAACGLGALFLNPNLQGIPMLGITTQQMRKFSGGMTLTFGAVAAMWPAAMQFLFLAGSGTALLQSSLLRMNVVKRAVNIPEEFPSVRPLPTAGQTPEEAMEVYRQTQLATMQRSARSPYWSYFMSPAVKTSVLQGVIPPGFGDLSHPQGYRPRMTSAAIRAQAAQNSAEPTGIASLLRFGGSEKDSQDYVSWSGLKQAPPPPPPLEDPMVANLDDQPAPSSASVAAAASTAAPAGAALLTAQELAARKAAAGAAPKSVSGKNKRGKGKRRK